MESGSVLGLSSSVFVLGLTGWLVSRFFAGTATWRAVIVYTLAVACGALIVCGANYMLAYALNVVDSSHGFMSVGVPIVFGITAALVAISAFTFGALGSATPPMHSPPIAQGEERAP
jgi:hypothetical protein